MAKQLCGRELVNFVEMTPRASVNPLQSGCVVLYNGLPPSLFTVSMKVSMTIITGVATTQTSFTSRAVRNVLFF